MLLKLTIFLFFVTFFSTCFYFYIKHAYRIFSQKEDQKDRIKELIKKINSSKTYLRNHYVGYISQDINPKVDFILKLIKNKTQDEQEKELNFLLDMLTETFIRLRLDYNNIPAIVSPLNSLRDRLAQEHIDILKSYMDF